MIFMSEKMVDGYLEHATSEMFREKRKEIRCPCRKCKQRYLLSPFSGALKEHLLMSGFMDSHKHWMTIDEEEPAVVNVNEAPSTENDDDQEHDEGDHDDGEDVEHVVDDIIQVDNNVDADSQQTPLTSVVRDPHLQDLLLEKTKCAKRKSKLEQLETDSNTLLYDSGRRLEESRSMCCR